MSSSSRSKSKGKKAGKEPSKASLKPSSHVNSNGVISASGCNPLLGAFHALETAPAPSASPLHVNGRLRNIDDEDQNGNSVGDGIEYDSVSNNGSWSGDSEDHNHKEKTSQPPPRQETVPGADNDKREKIRQKNEKKHQRQKERRAQELHERCSGYIMSRKLEALGQQLVAMGFSQEKATMALILNEGRVEESVAWLFEGGADDKPSEHTLDGGGNLKIDITEELDRITEMEVRYKASKQEVERVVVTCEGDLEMAEETLKAQKREPPASLPKPEETSDPPVANGKLQMVSSQNSMRVLLMRPSSCTSTQQKRAEKDFNYTKLPTTTTPLDPGAKSVPAIPPKMEWPKPLQIALPSEKRWHVPGSNPSVSYSIASSLQASPAPTRTESHHVAVGNEFKGLQLGSVREPVSAMQRPQSISLKQNPSSIISSSPPGTAVGRYPNRVETTMPNVLVQPAVTRSLSPHGVSSNPSFNLSHYQSQQQFASVNGHLDPQGTMRQTSSWSRGGPSPTVAAASSLGLFSGPGINGSSGSSSPVDWTTGSSMFQCDYSNIDWSLDRGGMSTRPNGLWTTTRTHNSFSHGSNVNSAMRPVLSNGSEGPIPGLHGRIASSENNNGVSQEWTTPFEERDLFGLSRQFVTSPSL